MAKKDYQAVCDSIAAISPYIRFVGIIGKGGDLVAYRRRADLKPFLNAKDTQYQFSHIAIKTDMEAFFDKNLGEVEFVWEERKKVQTISFAIKNHRVWISIDKKVIRTEMLRIIDSCLPIVKKFS
ncbi:hypothetical protein NsoK4_02415 [Nitrosopumilus sp. K4]|uniref:DUF6659 family protein n=1 Tax=Nitrosopumilus sp. K4 TaxID=2795383 RepID=UPI001BAC2E07|nr:DUF6659 family protein [Nitrosopumilus sp. K4]QUC65138.1 hypothetical protein NsoK4_02415 [Nitrosopumilus sp. K4]